MGQNAQTVKQIHGKICLLVCESGVPEQGGWVCRTAFELENDVDPPPG
jgi:hypothetical protein